MNKILFIAGIEGVYDITDLTDFEKCFNIAGGNVGNFVYGRYGRSYLCYDKEHSVTVVSKNQIDAMVNIDEQFDKVVMFCANQINPNDKYILQFYDFFEQTKLPIILLGLGCQSNINYDMKFLETIPDHIKLLKMLSNKKNVFIGVRGKFTKKCFDKLGIKCTITGCPSYYRKRSGYIRIIQKKQPKIDTSCEWFNKRDIWYEIIKKNYDMQIICQSSPERSLYRLSLGKATENDFLVVNNLFGINEQFSNQDNPFTNRCHLFFKVEDWANYIQQRDFYFGSKIHGCLIHLINGIPGFLIVHDSRTREFAELFSIPHIKSTKLTSDIDIYKIYRTYSVYKMQLKYIKLYWRYLSFLKKAGLKTTLRKRDIIKYFLAIPYTFIRNMKG